MSESTTAEWTFPAETTSVGRARRAVRSALAAAGARHLLDAAELVVSELVTNAVVHAGTEVRLRITAESHALRVEVEDGSPHLPTRRTWSRTAGTGRGLLIVDGHASRWDAARTGDGKVVWFEIGDPSTRLHLDPPAASAGADAVDVTLVDLPLLMHWAWQEHAASLLREYLLSTLAEDMHALVEHAAASDALSLLSEQLPVPALPAEPEALMATSVELSATGHEVALRVPSASVPHFEVLDHLLVRAVAAAEDGRLLGPPTQPEIAEMREWLCGEVAAQARNAAPTPWRAKTDVRVRFDADAGAARPHPELAGSAEPLIATSDTGVIVAVTPSVVTFLGYADEADLLGRRVLVVVPTRYHQAHIAGTTLHVTNGRDPLLRQWITVPVVRADGSEVPVEMYVEPRRLAPDRRVFVARFRL